MTPRTNLWTFLAATAALALLPLTACSTRPADTRQADGEQRAEEPHGDKDHHGADDHQGDADHHGDGGHHDRPLTEQDVKLPTSFADGVARLKELHNQIDHLIEHGELGDVHHAAEEMAIVARKMKELAAQDVAAEQRTDAGRLCNEVAGYFRPIDEAADAGKKQETTALHQQMAETIGKLEALIK